MDNRQRAPARVRLRACVDSMRSRPCLQVWVASSLVWIVAILFVEGRDAWTQMSALLNLGPLRGAIDPRFDMVVQRYPEEVLARLLVRMLVIPVAGLALGSVGERVWRARGSRANGSRLSGADPRARLSGDCRNGAASGRH